MIYNYITSCFFAVSKINDAVFLYHPIINKKYEVHLQNSFARSVIPM